MSGRSDWRAGAGLSAVGALVLVVGYAMVRTRQEPGAPAFLELPATYAEQARRHDVEARRQDDLGLRAEAEQTLKESINLWALVLASQPGNIEARLSLADALFLQGDWVARAGRWNQAEQVLDRAIRSCQAVPNSVRGDERMTRKCIQAFDRHGWIYANLGQVADACRERARAAEAARALAVDSRREDQLWVLRLELDWAEALMEAGRLPAAAGVIDRANRRLPRLGDESAFTESELELAATIAEHAALLQPPGPEGSAHARELLGLALGRRQRRVALLEQTEAGSRDLRQGMLLDEALARLARLELTVARSLCAARAFAEAQSHAERALALDARRVRLHPGSHAARADEALARVERARIAAAQGDRNKAAELLIQGANTLENLHRDNRIDALLRENASLALWALCDLDLARGDHASAARDVTRYLALETPGYDEALESAQFLCRAIELARQDHALSASARAAAIDRYSAAALAALRTAVDRGLRDRALLATTPILSPIRATRPFRELMETLEQLNEP